jgi:DNA-directed RNA polymerase subunit K/omega
MKMKEYTMALEPISIRQMEDKTQDVYEAVVVMSKRAKQVLNNRIVEEIMDSTEEVEMGVYDQVIEKNPEDYEELEKSSTVAVNEFIEGDLKWDNKVREDD